MRIMIWGVAASTIGAALIWSGHGHNYDGIVHKPPSEVYAAFSDQAGDVTASPPKVLPEGPVIREVTRVDGRSIKLVFRQQDQPLLAMDFNFEPADGGAATHLTADFDVDLPRIRRQMAQMGGDQLPYVPKTLVNLAFSKFMEEAVREIEDGRQLSSISPDGVGVPMDPSSTRRETEWQAQMAQRQASEPTGSAKPMTDAKPMINPNESSRGYSSDR
jgi:hypothetical protein